MRGSKNSQSPVRPARLPPPSPRPSLRITRSGASPGSPTPPFARNLEKAGVRCQTVNLAAGDFTEIPSDFDYVLNLAVAKSGSWDKDLGANAESVGLLMAHCRGAQGFLHCSSGAVNDPPVTNPGPSTPPG